MRDPDAAGRPANPCASCTRRCCHHYIVTVNGYDAWVISSGLRLAPEQFLVPVAQKTRTPHGFEIDGSGRTYEIALDKAKARTKEKPCTFWVSLGEGIGRCGIYPLRPGVCQTYPAHIEASGLVLRRDDVLCPTEAFGAEVVGAPQWRQRLRQMQVQYDIYARAVARWNCHVGRTARPEHLSLFGYYNYLMHFYDRVAEAFGAGNEYDETAANECWGRLLARGFSPLAEDRPEMARWAGLVSAVREVAFGFFVEELVD
ncbi:MAG TPA: YkgJ family cysteine cluster protein [Actinomycetota bacterium]|nr:YkgJ family cysteine cluster protein [Actinomycetota bacterium]